MSERPKFDFKTQYTGNLKWLEKGIVNLTIHGSHAYGMARPESDVDVRGICVPPKEYFLGFASTFEQAEQKGDPDLVIYDIRKFFNLASKCNPNVLEIINTAPSDWIVTTPTFEKLYENRHLFLSKAARWSYAGYAFAQLKRIKNHRGWILNPPKKKPVRSDFGLPDAQKLNASDVGAVEFLIANSEEYSELPGQLMALVNKEKAYKAALGEWNSYENWKATRNKARFELEEKHHYDTKHAAHLVRLMRTCREVLVDHTINVHRPDAEELKAVRNGAWTYDRLIEWAEEQETLLDALYETSTLPHKPDVKKLDALCMELVEMHWKNNP